MPSLKCFIVCILATACTATSSRQNRPERVRSKTSKRFNMPVLNMPASGPGGSPMGGPFHHGPMSGPGMVMGGGNPMQGPMTGGGRAMNPAMAGPHSPGHSSMFSGSSYGCVRHQIVCPRWCLIIDEMGCHSCPCGPAAGMALPQNNLMSGIMSSTTGNYQSATSTSSESNTSNQCMGQMLCMSSCKNSYTLGPLGSDGCRSCTCQSGSGYGYGGGSVSSGGFTGSGSVGGGYTSGGAVGGYTGGNTGMTGTGQVSTNQVTYVQKPRECTATQLCIQTCETGYQLGAVQTDGCQECFCPPKKQYVYVQQVVQPPKKEYVYTTQVQTYKPVVNTFTCSSTLRCDYGCNVGYKCGPDGCPVCECIHPQVVGLQVEQIILPQSVQCTNTFSCPSSCQLGYKCGPDGCPTCECLIAVQSNIVNGECVDCDDIDRVRPQYVRPPKQYVVVKPQVETCHNCETTQQQQVVYLQKQTECHNCETKPQIVYQKPQQLVYIQKPKPQPQKVVYVTQTQTQTQTCHGCETVQPQVVYTKPKPQKVVYVKQPQEVCHNCGEKQTHSILMTHLVSHGGSSGSYIYGGGTSGGRSYSGGSSGGRGIYSGGSSGGNAIGGAITGMNSGNCLPLRHDCEPSCIKYDTPHCRRCECEQPNPQFAGLLRGKR